jgi:hypothetical protein
MVVPKMGIGVSAGTPSPSPPKFLVFMELRGIYAQITARGGVRGKFLLIKELGRIVGSRTVLRWAEGEKLRTNVTDYRSNHLAGDGEFSGYRLMGRQLSLKLPQRV